MKLFLVTLLVTFGLYGCTTTNYHKFSKAGKETPWEGPYYSDAAPEESAELECNAPAFYGSYAVRIHNEDSGEVRTYICNEYPKYTTNR